ncbi:hypothetical protein CHUAL_000267 [Chamberlinius hualienensis]
MFLLNKDMRYYRLWIYLCNVVLFLGMITFTLVAGTMLTDPRTRMVQLPMHHPTFIYAYITLVVQGGILPAIGCYGAVRLNERWLNVYWAVLLLVLVGDIVVGVAWIFLFGDLTRNLPGDLLSRFQTNYAQEYQFTTAWNSLQKELRCCGVQGPTDFNGSKWWASVQNSDQRLPPSCLSSSLTNSDFESGDINFTLTNATLWTPSTATTAVEPDEDMSFSDFQRPKKRAGCVVLILDWLRHCTHVLFVLGYCVMTFLKICFLGILRYEIREMVQKIKVLQGDMSAFPELIALGLHAPVMHPKHRLMPDYAYGRCPIRNKSFFFSFDKKKIKAKMKSRNGNNNELEMTELTPNGQTT